MVDIATAGRGLTQHDDGIWYAASSQRVSYPDEGHDACFAVEERSFWFRHRNACIAAAVKRLPPAGALFDIGGGNGYVAKGLADQGIESVVVEPGGLGARNARRRGLQHVICATTDDAGFADCTLPAIGLFDVIEHVQDDYRFLRRMAALLAPGGRLYATVPAYGWLWSDEDVHAGHFRRHTLGSMAALVRQAGLSLEYATYFFRWLPLPILLLRALPHRLGLQRRGDATESASRDHAVAGGRASRVLNAMLAPEVQHVANGRTIPFGGSCLLVARRPGVETKALT